jgi:hypothetical protein
MQRIVERGAGALQSAPPKNAPFSAEAEKQGLSPSRIDALGHLAERAASSVSLGQLADLFRDTCCACGAQDLPTYCSACPMLELVNRVLTCTDSR